MTKKIITLLLVVSLLVANVFAGGFAGINAGPSFDIYTLKPEGTSERSDTYVDSGVAIDLYGAFLFGEKENIGLGIKLGADANISTRYDGHDVSNDLAETDFTPAVTFLYRIGLTDSIDFLLGAGLEYAYHGSSSSVDGYSVSSSYHSFGVSANTDFAFRFGHFGILAGVNLGVPFVTIVNSSYGGYSDSMNIGKLGVQVTPHAGVFYCW